MLSFSSAARSFVELAVAWRRGRDAVRGRSAARPEDSEAERLQRAQEVRFQLEQALADAGNPAAREEVDRGVHTVDAADVQHARFVALRGRDEDDFILRLEIRRADIPRAKQGRSQQFEMRLF